MSRGDGAGFGALQDVMEFGEPFVVVDGFALAGVELGGGEAEDGAGCEVEPAPDFFADEITQGSQGEGRGEEDGGPCRAGHVVPPRGARRGRAGAGGR